MIRGATAAKTWRRVTLEIGIIVLSVFVAVAMESAWQERQRAADARTSLGQLLAELRADRVMIDAVLAEQRALDKVYRQSIDWLADPETLPAADFARAMETLAYSNLTLFPRHAAWTTMVESGELPLLEDPELVTRLGNLYGDLNDTALLNAAGYDHQLFTEMREYVASVWDFNEHRLLTGDAREIAEFRGRLRVLHHTWNQWYLEFMSEQYLPELESLIAEVDAFLDEHG